MSPRYPGWVPATFSGTTFGPPPVGNGDLVIFWPVLGLGHLRKFRVRARNRKPRIPGGRGTFGREIQLAQKFLPAIVQHFYAVRFGRPKGGKSQNTGFLAHFGLDNFRAENRKIQFPGAKGTFGGKSDKKIFSSDKFFFQRTRKLKKNFSTYKKIASESSQPNNQTKNLFDCSSARPGSFRIFFDSWEPRLRGATFVPFARSPHPPPAAPISNLLVFEGLGDLESPKTTLGGHAICVQQ